MTETLTSTLSMDKNYVLTYIDDHDIKVGLLDSNDPQMQGIYQFTCPTGFSTFDVTMTEDQAKYAAVLFCRLTQEHNVDFGNAERLSAAYVNTFKVMQEEASREATEEERQMLLDALSNTIEATKEENEDD